MKYWKIIYWLHNQSKLFSQPQAIIAKTLDEKYDILNKCDTHGYIVEDVQEFDPVPYDERYYA